MNIAVVLAGGTGSRFGADKPKQFLMLNGVMVIEHSIRLFESIDDIDEIVVVVHRDYVGFMRQVVAERGWRKVTRVIEGGEERYHSTLNAVRALMDYVWHGERVNIILHDAARPWLTMDIVERTVAALQHHDAVAVGIRSTDTIWRCKEEGDVTVADIPPRSEMWRAQTPQAFELGVLVEAYRRALKDSAFVATDDCGVVHRYMPEVEISVVEGSEANRKVTFKGDI